MDWIFIYNSTFCQHSVFMCFVWIREQTAIISLYSINWLVFVTKTECVYCAVGAESLFIIQHGTLGSIPRQSMWCLWWTNWQWDRFPSKYFVFPLSISFHQRFVLIVYTAQKEKRANLGNLTGKKCCFEIRGAVDRNVLLITFWKGQTRW
jgi:hypothetical protein